MRSPLLSLAVLILSSPGLAAAGKVWVVDAALGPGAHFASIQPAIDAATSGDLVLVRPGIYKPFVLVGKGLHIASDTKPSSGAAWVGPGATRVEGVPSGAVATISGMGFAGDQTALFPGSLPALSLRDNDGVVMLQGCGALFGRPAVRIERSASVYVLSCEGIQGAQTMAPSPPVVLPGGEGMLVLDSRVALYESTVVGGWGMLGTLGGGVWPTSAGGTAIELVGSELFLANSDVMGGSGGPSIAALGCASASAGGDAVRADAASTVTTAHAFLTAGSGGTEAAGCVPHFASGGATFAGAGTLDALAAFPPAVIPTSTPAPSALVREGQIWEYLVGGGFAPGDLLYAAVGLGGVGHFLDISLAGVLAPQAPAVVFGLGAFPTGSWPFYSFPVGELGAGVEFVAAPIQWAVCSPASATCTLGKPWMALLLDSAF